MALQLKKQSAPVGTTKWFDYDEDTKVEVAGIDNPDYQIGLERMRRRLRKNDERFNEGTVGVVDGEKTEHQNHCLLLAHFIVKGWEGAQDESGNPIKYTPTIGAQMLEGDVDFFIFTLRSAAEFTAESKEDLEETVGKSSTDTTGKRNGRAKPKNDGSSMTA
ncbi:hypothetical protein [Pseudomonas sp. RC10]|uniref:hypothetical protein n=1 Tax=Pseudomonas bambusae TaxID=3139142 RepID=UPI00313928C8